MNRLPLELVDRISSFLNKDDLKRTLYVSPAFQVAAENHSGEFSEYSFEGLNLDCEKFLATYGGRRLRHLCYIAVNLQYSPLTPWSADAGELQCRETRADLDVKNRIFTEQVRRVFETIKEAEIAAKAARHGPGKVQLTIFTPYRLVYSESCRHRLSSAWRVRLLNCETLPTLESVRGLSICNPDRYAHNHQDAYKNGYDRAISRVEARTVIDLAVRLPRLEYLGCSLGTEEWRLHDEDPARKHFEHDYEGCAKDSRIEFGKALAQAQLPTMLREVQLDFFHDLSEHMLTEERGGGPDLAGPATYDVFSSSLCLLAQRLSRLDLRVKADASLFQSTLDETPFSNLQHMSIMLHPMTPSGSWYFCGTDGQGASDVGYQVTNDMYPPLDANDPEDANWHDRDVTTVSDLPETFRQIPNDITMNPFLEAFAKLALTMRELKAFCLWSPLAGQRAWGIAYAAPGEESPFYEYDGWSTSEPRLWWKVGTWTPEQDLHNSFQEIGRARHGKEPLEYWNSEKGGTALEYRETFEESSAALPTSGPEYPTWRWSQVR